MIFRSLMHLFLEANHGPIKIVVTLQFLYFIIELIMGNSVSLFVKYTLPIVFYFPWKKYFQRNTFKEKLPKKYSENLSIGNFLYCGCDLWWIALYFLTHEPSISAYTCQHILLQNTYLDNELFSPYKQNSHDWNLILPE